MTHTDPGALLKLADDLRAQIAECDFAGSHYDKKVSALLKRADTAIRQAASQGKAEASNGGTTYSPIGRNADGIEIYKRDARPVDAGAREDLIEAALKAVSDVVCRRDDLAYVHFNEIATEIRTAIPKLTAAGDATAAQTPAHPSVREALKEWIEQGYIDADGEHCGSAAYAPAVYERSVAALAADAAQEVKDPILTPRHFLDDILAACDASNWDADRNKGDYLRGLNDAYETILNIAVEYQTSIYAWCKREAPSVPSAHRGCGDPNCKDPNCEYGK